MTDRANCRLVALMRNLQSHGKHKMVTALLDLLIEARNADADGYYLDDLVALCGNWSLARARIAKHHAREAGLPEHADVLAEMVAELEAPPPA